MKANFISGLNTTVEKKLKTVNSVFENRNGITINAFTKNDTCNIAEFKSLQKLLNIVVEREADLEIIVNKISLLPDSSIPDNNLDKILLWRCGSAISKYQPVIYDMTDNKVYPAYASNISHFKHYIGICLNDYEPGDIANIQVYGLLYDIDFNYNTTNELFVGEGILTQNLNIPNIAYQQSVGNILTKNTIFLSYCDPIKLRKI